MHCTLFLCFFIKLTVMSLPGQLNNENNTQKVCFFILWRALRFGIICHITKVGVFFLIFPEDLNNNITYLRPRFR